MSLAYGTFESRNEYMIFSMNGFLTILLPMNQFGPVPMTISYCCKKFSESRDNCIDFSSAHFHSESRAGFPGTVEQILEGSGP